MNNLLKNIINSFNVLETSINKKLTDLENKLEKKIYLLTQKQLNLEKTILKINNSSSNSNSNSNNKIIYVKGPKGDKGDKGNKGDNIEKIMKSDISTNVNIDIIRNKKNKPKPKSKPKPKPKTKLNMGGRFAPLYS